MKLARILCPVDFSETSTHAIAQAVALAGCYKSRITALHVFTPLEWEIARAEPSFDQTAEIDRLGLTTREEFASATAKGIDVDVVIDHGAPARAILARASSLPADLIVIGTHGTSGFQRFVLGSVTEKVLRQATCPVLTIPPRAHATSPVPFTRLLCAVDFSDSSLDAVGSALSIAQDSGATLTLLHVLEWPWEEPPAPVFADLPLEQRLALTEFRRYSEASARGRLESLVPDSLPPSRVATRVENGKPHAQVLRVAAEEQSDLIVIGVRGRNPLDLTIFGSTANQVVRAATCPVLTLR